MENHLTELLDGLIEEPYSEATCREPDARLMQVARHSGEAPRRRGWAAEPSFRVFAPSGDSARELTPGSRSRGSIRCGGNRVSPTGPLLGYRRALMSEAGMNPASRRVRLRLLRGRLRLVRDARGGRWLRLGTLPLMRLRR